MNILRPTFFATFASACLALAAAPAFSAPDNVIKPTHVVELFTSQGCSSCPPANKFVGNLAEEDGVLALSYGVTYWDYLGWKDTFGSHEFTQRQRDYRDAMGAANIYTPQIVLNGSAHSPRFTRKDVLSMPLPATTFATTLQREGTQLLVQSDAPADHKLVLVSYLPGEQYVDVKRGENGGRQLRLTNVVTGVTPIAWTGKRAKLTPPAAQADNAYAVLVHAPDTAKIVSAATLLP